MKYTAFIKNVETGEVREYIDEYEDQYLPSLEYIWSEGNFACDCNRANFFFDDDDLDRPCGDGHYTVSHLILENGTRIEIQS